MPEIEPAHRVETHHVMQPQPSVIDVEHESKPVNKRPRLSSPPISSQLPYTESDLGNEAQPAAQSPSCPLPLDFSDYPPQAILPSTSSLTSPSSSSTLPLSSANLERLQAISPSTVRSEPVRQPWIEVAPEESSEDSEEESGEVLEAESGEESEEESGEQSEEGSQAGSVVSDITMDKLSPIHVHPILERNFLFINDDKAREIGDTLITKAMRILDSKRGSDYGAAKALEVKAAIKDYTNENEMTFVINLLKQLLNEARMVPVNALTDAELEVERQWLEKAWNKDHLRARFETNFASDCIPKIEVGNDYSNKALQQVLRVTVPRPDVCWGIYQTAFTHLQQTFLTNLGCALANPDLYNIFFIIEAKCMNGSIQAAENQCCRSGAAMVQNRRRFNSFVASKVPALPVPVTYPNADLDTFAFSLAVAPDRANLSVHWCLEDDGKAIYWHMHFLKTYSFNRAEELTMLHHDMDNILDWGIGPRKTQVVRALEDMEARQVVVPKPPSPQKRKVAQMST